MNKHIGTIEDDSGSAAVDITDDETHPVRLQVYDEEGYLHGQVEFRATEAKELSDLMLESYMECEGKNDSLTIVTINDDLASPINIVVLDGNGLMLSDTRYTEEQAAELLAELGSVIAEYREGRGDA